MAVLPPGSCVYSYLRVFEMLVYFTRPHFAAELSGRMLHDRPAMPKNGNIEVQGSQLL